MKPVAPLDFAPHDSARFGLRIFRASLQRLDANAIRSAFDSEDVDIAIVRVPADRLADVRALDAAGLDTIVADTLVRHDAALDLLDTADRRPSSLQLIAALPFDKPRLERMAREIFAGYVSHYHVNPRFGHAAIIDGYAEWAANHADSDNDGRGAWIVESNGVEVGFSCYRIDSDHPRAHGVLNGILPSARRNGAYRNMLRAMLARFAADGISAFEISTQVHNVAVQRVWADLGLRLIGAETTLHISRRR